MTNRLLLAALCIPLSALQAWDSNALEAEPHIQALIALAIVLVPAAMLTSARTHVHLGAVVISAGLLVTARVASAVHMPELVLAAVFPGVLAMLNHVRSLVRQGSA